MVNYYEVVVGIVIGQLKSGKDKIQKENILVDAMSCTEAEARVVDDFVKSKTQLEYNVISVKESRIGQVINA